jgi:ATP-binding protein involved in chromosome partitioning
VSDIKNVIAVASGKGGVGKSTVSVNLALSLKEQGYQVGLLDADIYGPSVPLMLKTEGKRPTTPDNKTFNPILASGIELMSIGYIVLKDEATIWRGPMMSKAIEQLLFNTNWSDLDYLIIDLPPGTGDAQLTLSKKANLSAAILVSTPQKVALLDVKKSLEAFQKLSIPVLGLIENMSYFICDKCGDEHEIFGKNKVQDFLNENSISLIGRIPINPSIAFGEDEKNSIAENPDGNLSNDIFDEIAKSIDAQIKNI